MFRWLRALFDEDELRDLDMRIDLALRNAKYYNISYEEALRAVLDADDKAR